MSLAPSAASATGPESNQKDHGSTACLRPGARFPGLTTDYGIARISQRGGMERCVQTEGNEGNEGNGDIPGASMTECLWSGSMARWTLSGFIENRSNLELRKSGRGERNPVRFRSLIGHSREHLLLGGQCDRTRIEPDRLWFAPGLRPGARFAGLTADDADSTDSQVTGANRRLIAHGIRTSSLCGIGVICGFNSGTVARSH